jgi:acyl carrier protein
MKNVADVVRWAITQVTKGAHGPELADDAHLITQGILNSLSMLGLIAQVEAELNIRIPVKEITRDNFESLKTITSLVERHVRAT